MVKTKCALQKDTKKSKIHWFFIEKKIFFWAWVKFGYLQYLKIHNSAQKKYCDVRIGLFCSIFLGLIVFFFPNFGTQTHFLARGSEWLPKNFTPLKILHPPHLKFNFNPLLILIRFRNRLSQNFFDFSKIRVSKFWSNSAKGFSSLRQAYVSRRPILRRKWWKLFLLSFEKFITPNYLNRCSRDPEMLT